jgi:hypothetical protein
MFVLVLTCNRVLMRQVLRLFLMRISPTQQKKRMRAKDVSECDDLIALTRRCRALFSDAGYSTLNSVHFTTERNATFHLIVTHLRSKHVKLQSDA